MNWRDVQIHFATLLFALLVLALAPAKSLAVTCEESFYSTIATPEQLRVMPSLVHHGDGGYEVLTKLSYELNPDAWRLASRDPAYRLRLVEISITSDLLSSLGYRPQLLIDFGFGDGSKAANILETLRAQSPLEALPKYAGVDLNPSLLNLAREVMPHDVDSNYFLSRDLEALNLYPMWLEIRTAFGIRHRTNGVVGLLLGQTLGNPRPEGRKAMLENIRRALPTDSDFIAGLAMVPKKVNGRYPPGLIEGMLAGYTAGAYRQLISGGLLALAKAQTLAEIGTLKMHWNERDHSVEAYVSLKKNIRLPDGRLLLATAEGGKPILILRSHRFEEGEVTELLEQTGFRQVTFHYAPGYPYALARARASWLP